MTFLSFLQYFQCPRYLNSTLNLKIIRFSVFLHHNMGIISMLSFVLQKHVQYSLKLFLLKIYQIKLNHVDLYYEIILEKYFEHLLDL